jgi:hypothetical protein
MTTITIERAVLLRALEALRPATAPNGAKRDAAFEELRAALAAPATTPAQPAWHDAPTVPGVWICDEGDICYTWTAHNIEILDQFDPGDGLRWYGPIPPDGDKP